MKLKRFLILASMGVFSLVSCNSMINNGGKLSNKVDSASYALGVYYGNQLKGGGMDKINPEALAKAIHDVYDSAKLQITPEQAGTYLQTYFAALQAEKEQKNSKDSKKFLDENKKKEGVVTLPSGLQYKVIKEGTGATPTAADTVICHYKGTLVNGTVFDSSIGKEPVTFPVTGVIPGWTEALMKMKVGSKWQLVIPSELAYGERGGGPIPPSSTLIFDIELLEIVGKK